MKFISAVELLPDKAEVPTCTVGDPVTVTSGHCFNVVMKLLQILSAISGSTSCRAAGPLVAWTRRVPRFFYVYSVAFSIHSLSDVLDDGDNVEIQSDFVAESLNSMADLSGVLHEGESQKHSEENLEF